MAREPDWSGPDLSAVGALLADPARIAIIMALAGGTELSPGELARRAGIAPSTASHHVARLVEAGWLSVHVSGRHRLYRLASADVADLLERIARLAPERPVVSLRGDRQRSQLRLARCCYDHMAGRLGVTVAAGLLRAGYVVGDGEALRVTDAGWRWIAEEGIELDRAKVGRELARPCMDWTEQGLHIAGAFGRALMEHWLDRGWIERRSGSRALEVTSAGAQELLRLGVDWGGDARPARVA